MRSVARWPANKPAVRTHSHAFGSTPLDPRTDPNCRVSPLAINNNPTPALYGGTSDRAAAAETIFRRLHPDTARKRVFLEQFITWQWSQVACTRTLTLITVEQPDVVDS